MADNTTSTNPWLEAWIAGQQEFFKAQMPFFPGMNPAADDQSDMPEAMQRAQANWELLQKQASDWLKAAQRWMTPEVNAAAKGEGIAAETLRRMLDPTQFMFAGLDEINHAIQRLVEGPEFADIGMLERQVLKATTEWLALREASAAYRVVIGMAWSRAFETFSKEMATNPSAATGGPRAALDRWLAIANDELIKTQRTDAFLEAQRKLLRAGVDYRVKERELVEVWCETHSIPTRTEVDDLHLTVHDLRRQVRDLKKQLTPSKSAVRRTEAKKVKSAARTKAASPSKAPSKTATKPATATRGQRAAKTSATRTTKAAPKRAAKPRVATPPVTKPRVAKPRAGGGR